MKLLLTSSGITNPSLRAALEKLLGKPISEANALFVPTGMHPFPSGGQYAFKAMCGEMSGRLCGLGWKSLGLLELTALTSISKDVWVNAVQEADALLVWGGDPIYISYWMKETGLGELLHTLDDTHVYVGVSAGAMAATTLFGETYPETPTCRQEVISSEQVTFHSTKGDFSMEFRTARGIGLVDFNIIAHLGAEWHTSATIENAEIWANKVPVPTYAIDDSSGVQVVAGDVEVVTEGTWRLFNG